VSFKYDHQLPLGTQNMKELSKGYSAKYRFENIIGESNEILKAKKIAKRLAPSDITILIEGDSGTGKELFASAIQNHSSRGSEKFLAINFSALPDDLIESELFGYVDGAFTGAKKGGKKGLFEEADGGTIFLDEIGDVSLKVQTRLLRVLEEKEIMPIGSNEIIPINVRVIAATNKDLEQRVSNNEFRKDLYYRLKMGYIHLPSLKERKSDIGSLAKHLIDQSTVNSINLSDDVIDFFRNYDWPGNIRELKNIITYMIAYTDKSNLTMEDLPQKYYFKDVDSKDQPLPKTYDYQLDRNEIYILNCINDLISSGIKPSRKKISTKSEVDGFSLSINQVRRILNELEELDLIIKRKGRYGTNITQKGLEIIGL
jgi:transcriptional regulator with PAS, ATPase and Fis domain